MATFLQQKEQTHYAVLGVDESADAVTIKNAFRSLVLRYHPDKAKSRASERSSNSVNNGNRDDDDSEMINAIQKAYNVLREPTLRQAYDAQLQLERTRQKGRWESAIVIQTSDCITEHDEDGSPILVYPCRCGAYLDTSPLEPLDDDDVGSVNEEDGLLECPGCSLVYDIRQIHIN